MTTSSPNSPAADAIATPGGRSPLLGPSLTYAFAGAIAMWSVGYVLRLPGEAVPAPLLAGVLLLLHLGACLLAGRSRGVAGGAGTGLILAGVNLLVLGSLRDDFFRGEAPNAGLIALFVLGWLAFGLASGAVMGWVGTMTPKTTPAGASATRRVWAFRLAIVTAAGALLLLIKGGLVTSAEQGLAVPDWPNTFGSNMFLYPLSRMTGGVYLEHAHRLFGALIGLTTIALTVYTFAADRRWWVRVFVGVCLLWVIVQGVLGGFRVTETNQALGMVHGITGQMFVAMLAALAAALSPRWDAGPREDEPPDSVLRALAPLATIALLVQIGFGAAVRHFDMQLHALFSHIGWSIVATILIVAAAFRAFSLHRPTVPIRKFGKANLHSVIFQMFLGLVALMVVMREDGAEEPGLANLLFTTAHQAIGAVLLVVSVQLSMWTYRLVPPGRTPAQEGHSGEPPVMS